MKVFIKRFSPYIKAHLAHFIIAIVAGIIAAICTALISYILKPVLDDVFIRKDSTMLLILPVAILGLYAGKSVGVYVQSYTMNLIGQDIVREIRNRLLRHILSLEMQFFNKMRSGELVARITSDIEIIRASVSSYVADIVREGITIICLICVVFYQNPKLALIGLIVIPASIIPINIIARKIKRASKKAMEQNSDIMAKLNEIFNNAEMIKASSSESNEIAYFEKANYAFFKLNMKITQQNQLINPLMELLGAIMVAVMIYIGGSEVIADKMTAGAFISFVAALFMIYTPLKKLIGVYAGMQGAFAASNRIFEILDKVPEIKDGEVILNAPIDSIRFRAVSLQYDNVAALKNINADFYKDEIVALVGKSGSGKSSMVNLILRLYSPQSGEVSINDIALESYTLQSLRDNIAIVTQKIFIFNDSVAINVAYGLEIDEARIIDALKKSFAWEFVENLPNGIHTILDEYGANLSGGQRQRIAIARAIYKNPQILIFDEATSALDEKTENLIKQSIDLIKTDKIIILIAHRPSTLALATKIIEISDGEIKSVKAQNPQNLTQRK